jgi:hypothetical protein
MNFTCSIHSALMGVAQMFEFIRQMFGLRKPAGRRMRSSGRWARLEIEGLQERVLPSASQGFLPVDHHHALQDQQSAFHIVNQGTGSQGSQSTPLSVQVQGTGGILVSAEFETRGGSNILEIELKNGVANQTYSVSLDGGNTILTTLTTDAAGKARTVLSSATLQVQAGTVLTLLDPSNTTVAQGPFAAGSTETHGCGGKQSSGLSLNAQGASGIELSAKLETQGSSTVLEIKLKNATANQTYSVSLDGGTTILTTLTTNQAGKAHAVVSSANTQVQAGTVLTLLDSTGATVLQGTFATSQIVQ